MYVRSSLIVQEILDFVRKSTIELSELIKKMYDSIILSFILNTNETQNYQGNSQWTIPGLFCVQVQVNLFQTHLFLQQLTHNMTKDCSLNYKFRTWKLQAQNTLRTFCVHKLFWMSKQKRKNNICTQHVLSL